MRSHGQASIDGSLAIWNYIPLENMSWKLLKAQRILKDQMES